MNSFCAPLPLPEDETCPQVSFGPWVALLPSLIYTQNSPTPIQHIKFWNSVWTSLLTCGLSQLVKLHITKILYIKIQIILY